MKRSNMESLNCSKGNTVGIVVAYFLIYVVWGSTYFFIGVALKDFSPFLLERSGLRLPGLYFWESVICGENKL
nr:hypothetical protein [Bacteroides sp. AM54-2NS]